MKSFLLLIVLVLGNVAAELAEDNMAIKVAKQLVASKSATDFVATGGGEGRASSRRIEAIIAEAFENLSQGIKDDGMDPFHFNWDGIDHRLPVTDLLALKANLEDFLVVGLSDIVINKINISYGLIYTTLSFDISLPRLSVSIKAANADLSFFGLKEDARVSGSLAIMHTHVTGDIEVFTNVITGVQLRSLALDHRFGTIQSNMRISLSGTDYSKTVNDAFSVSFPKLLSQSKDQINELLEHYVLEGLEVVMPSL